MAWTQTFTINSENSAIGAASAIFTDTDSTTFSFSDQIGTDTVSKTAFVNAAIAARNVWRTQKTTNSTEETDIGTLFTQLDV